MKAIERREHATERTEEAAGGALGEKADREQGADVKHVRPSARKLRRDRSLERLDLGRTFGCADGREREDQQRGRRSILAVTQAAFERGARKPPALRQVC